MGDRTSESASSSSSIALLQERFKKLQRAREVRKERELLKVLAESARVNRSVSHDPSSGSSFSSEYHHSSLPAQYFAQNHKPDHLQVNRNSPTYTNAGTSLTQVCGDDDDEGSNVDTSLHL
uniref:Uncharacterized protein n=1 Tax=Kalanchoe fedtschenkoi TaxID=63787 RepID=A0A7N0RCB9_KALFE